MTNFNEWSQLEEAAPTNILSRIIANTYPLVISNSILYLIYIGDEEKKDIFNKFYKEEKINLLTYLKNTYQIIALKPVNTIKKDEMEWIIKYSEKFGAKKISWQF
jgi:hypothetical protein